MSIAFALGHDKIGLLCADTRLNFHYTDGRKRSLDDGTKICLLPWVLVAGVGCYTTLETSFTLLKQREYSGWQEPTEVLRAAQTLSEAKLASNGMSPDAEKAALLFLYDARTRFEVVKFDFGDKAFQQSGYYLALPPDLQPDDDAMLKRRTNELVQPLGPAETSNQNRVCAILRGLADIFTRLMKRRNSQR
jgi:hypothetical protein